MNNQFDPQPFIDNAQLIETTCELEKFISSIKSEDLIAVDIESAGFFKYYNRVNLIQVATKNLAGILDPQKIKDFSAFADFAVNSSCKWIFHAGDYDISMLASDLGIYIPHMFDTRKAAEFLGLNELGLSALSEKFLGFALNKKLQRCDWSKRPLTSAMKKYALLDAVCLLPLHDILAKRLTELNRLEWVMQECEAIAQTAKLTTPQTQKPDAYRIKGSARLSLKNQAVLKEVWQLRDKIAQKIDKAPFMVLSNYAMLDIAKKTPRTIAGLAVIKGINSDFFKKNAEDVLIAVKKGLQADFSELKMTQRNNKKTMTPWEGELAKSIKELRVSIANRIGVAASLIMPAGSIQELVKSRPLTMGELIQGEYLHKWQAELVAEELLPLLAQTPPKYYGKKRRRRKKGTAKKDLVT